MAKFKQVKLTFTAEIMMNSNDTLDEESLQTELIDALDTVNNNQFLVAEEKLIIKG